MIISFYNRTPKTLDIKGLSIILMRVSVNFDRIRIFSKRLISFFFKKFEAFVDFFRVLELYILELQI